jgi:hypothetical protein
MAVLNDKRIEGSFFIWRPFLRFWKLLRKISPRPIPGVFTLEPYIPLTAVRQPENLSSLFASKLLHCNKLVNSPKAYLSTLFI